MTYQQGYCQRNKKKCQEKRGWYDEENKKRLQKMSIDWYKTLSEEENKNKKKNMLDFNVRTCPKKKKEIKFSQKNYR